MDTTINAVNKKHLGILLFPGFLSPRHYPMLRQLKEQNWTFSVIAWDRKGNSKVGNEDAELIYNWHWVRLLAPMWSIKLIMKLPMLYLRVLKAALKLKKRPDVWMCEHYFMLPCMLLLPGKKIYDALEMYSLELSFYFGSLQRLFYPILRLIEGLMVSRVHGVLTVDSRGGWLERFFRQWNDNVGVIWNVPSKKDNFAAPNDDTPMRERYSGRQVMAFVGGLIKEKGLMVALQACSLLKDAHKDILFLFIGDLKDRIQDINEILEAKGISEHVLFRSSMPYIEMLKHLRWAHIGLALHQRERIYPYVSAGNGRKFFTYMQAGLPIIGPDFDEVGMIVRKTHCGLLVDTSRPEAVAKAIEHLITHPEKAKAMGERGRTAFIEQYNWETEQIKFQKVMDSLGV
jgi:glycosyltransferase involved in cell wall biosynthesis